MAASGGGDIAAIIRGLIILGNEASRQAARRSNKAWASSSLTTAFRHPRHQSDVATDSTTEAKQRNASRVPPTPTTLQVTPSEVVARLSVVAQGVSAYLSRHSQTLALEAQAIARAAEASAAETVYSVQSAAASAVQSAATDIAAKSTATDFAQSAVGSHSSSSLPVNTSQSAPASVESIAPTVATPSKANDASFVIAGARSGTLHSASGFVSSPRMPNSKAYDPIMDPTVAELDLEKILGINNDPPEQPPHVEETNIASSRVLENFDIANDKIKTDLHEATELLQQNKDIEKLASLASESVNYVRMNVDKTVDQTRQVVDSLHQAVTHPPPFMTEDELNDIEEKLQSLQGQAFGLDMKAISEQASESEADIQEVMQKALREDAVPLRHPIDLIREQTDASSSPSQTKTPGPKLLGRKPLATDKPNSLLSETSRARRVPDTRLSRLVSFGGLAAGLGLGTLAEVTRRSLGVSKGGFGGATLHASSPFLTEANANRIVDTLCTVRGAALKLGQMISLTDNTFINPAMQQIFERVRQSADFMPEQQLQRMLEDELGSDWHTRFESFDERPFAAASIGQVHEGVLPDGRRVAVKVQYPGVAEGIVSDIDNLVATLNVAKIIPEHFFVDNIIEVAKRELAWECDYEREKECGEKFATLLAPYPQYYVPAVIGELSTKRVLTTELVHGLPVDKSIDMDQSVRNNISNLILELTIREIFEFGYMQTDPNWANFIYNESTKQIVLLDFGACRAYDKSFVDLYIEIIHGAATNDRDKVRHFSQEIGFLTGYEAKVMVEAHVDTVMILGEAFSVDGPAFSFKQQNTTLRVQNLMPTMLQHRMCPPPEEVYSLHRKMSGVFLLCAKLQGEVNVSPLFFEMYRRHHEKKKMAVSDDTR